MIWRSSAGVLVTKAREISTRDEPYSVCMTDAVPPERGEEVARPGDLRASHADRDRVIEALRAAAGDGRLTVDELDDRLEKALTARTVGELAGLSKDLPVVPGGTAGARSLEPKDTIRIDRQNGNVKRDGRWVVPRRIEVRVVNGHVRLDFTEAIITQPVLEIDVDVNTGTLTLLTMPGIDVDADEVVARDSRIRVRPPRGLEAPVILRIEVSGTISDSHIRARPRRRFVWR